MTVSKKSSFAVVLLFVAITTSSANGQAPAQAAQGSVSQRGTRQIGSSAANILGLRLGFSSDAFGQIPFTETATMVDALGTGYVEGSSAQNVSVNLPKKLDYNLSPDEQATVKAKLEGLRLRMLAYRVPTIPADEHSRRKLLGFAKNLGVETIVTGAPPSALAELDKLAGEFGVDVAIEGPDPKGLMKDLEGLSSRIGVGAHVRAWMQAGIKPIDGLRLVNNRLVRIGLQDRSALGSAGRDVDLGEGELQMEQFFLELAKLSPPVPPPPPTCGDCAGPRVPVKPLFVAIGRGTGTDASADVTRSRQAFEKAVRAAEGYQIVQISKKTPMSTAEQIPPLDRSMIQAAAPRQTLATPKKARKLLVIDLCPQGGFYHRTLAHANLAVALMAKNTGAFEPTFNNDLDNLKYPKIKTYDAIFLNSVVGSVFTDKEVINGLTRFVKEGGGVAAIHGSTYASTDVPEYGEMLGAQTGPHRIEVATLKVDDPNSPLTKQFEGHDVTHVDEFYHFLPTGPYSRDKLHVLLSIDMAKSDMTTPGQATRPDNDYGMAWIRTYGSGRVFNCALGHTPLLFSTPHMTQMVFAGIQFVLGDLEADTTPSARLSTRK
jgi:type 1 glutamine amidotransferase/sugar phosphate isomerase/epimerase